MSGAPSSPLRVPDLVSYHEAEAAKRSPSSSPTASRTLNPLSPPQGSTSPSPSSKALPAVDSLKLDSNLTGDSANNSTVSSRGASPSGSMSNSLVLEDIKEGEALKTDKMGAESDSDEEVDDAGMTESQLFPAKDNKEETKEGAEAIKEGEKKVEEQTTSASKDGKAEEKSDKPAAAAVAPVEEVDPLEKLRELLDSLPEQEQEVIRKNLDNIKNYPEALPLSAPWTLHFSDTSGANKSSHGTTQDQYDEGVKKVFSASTVPSLVGQLKAYKKLVRPKRFKANEPDGMGLTRAGQNLHFFREGVSPTWEDAWNAKGGRLIISPPSALFEAVFERLVLLLAGSVLECGATERLAASEKKGNEGLIIGVVASRRARGDRIELWLGGREPRQPAPAEWIDKLKESLSEELAMPELRHGKYKKHFS
ncbi:translation initiation factor eIF 4e-like domain-containing protein [Leucosporidium creatinivorum]|uniref:Translation initiation factor eIF 4e-like domain-containing protein n=1 Tax=Leucosporidium creatinivorum TaxID=106004 RepID=A0A1Y2DBL3_9BASI|nr:translation initiation factor eIF 4e-like domain-containing protein [Leucosporidium creatinivorum]